MCGPEMPATRLVLSAACGRLKPRHKRLRRNGVASCRPMRLKAAGTLAYATLELKLEYPVPAVSLRCPDAMRSASRSGRKPESWRQS